MKKCKEVAQPRASSMALLLPPSPTSSLELTSGHQGSQARGVTLCQPSKGLCLSGRSGHLGFGTALHPQV